MRKFGHGVGIEVCNHKINIFEIFETLLVFEFEVADSGFYQCSSTKMAVCPVRSTNV